jgi:uncharacterized protein YqgC (DUF456 family)
MTLPEILLFLLALIFMLVGLVGTVAPILPGVPLIWVVTLIYAALTKFSVITQKTVIIFGLLALLTIILDYISQVIGARKFGASKWGVTGAFLGLFAVFFMGPAGLILGPLLGAVALELLAGKKKDQALRSGMGAFVGFLAGSIIKIAVAAGMIAVFVWKVLAGA